MRGPEEYTKTVRVGHSLKWMADNYMAPKGINLKVVTVPNLNNESDETICKFIANALHPSYPRYRQDIESEINKLRICQDRIKTFSDWKKVNNQKENFTETIIDCIQDDIENTSLDSQIKRASQVQQSNGKRLIRIWGKPN